MDKDEIELTSDKIAFKAWQKFKTRVLFVSSIILIPLAYFGVDNFLDRNEIDRLKQATETAANEVKGTQLRINGIENDLLERLEKMQTLQKEAEDLQGQQQQVFKEELKRLSSSLLGIIGELNEIPDEIAPGLAVTLMEEQAKVEETVRLLNLSVCKFGIRPLQDDRWIEKLFEVVEGSVNDFGVPETGALLEAKVDINLRSGFPDQVEGKGLFFKPISGLLQAGDRVALQKTEAFELKDSTHYWISFVPSENS